MIPLRYMKTNLNIHNRQIMNQLKKELIFVYFKKRYYYNNTNFGFLSGRFVVTNKSRIICIGECMVELSLIDQNTYRKSFAGDTFNTAIYMKRYLRKTPFSVSYITAPGLDAHSDELQSIFHDEHLDSSLVVRIPDKQLGLYSIHTDNHGERSFNYWRNDSAEKQLFRSGLNSSQKKNYHAILI